MTSSDAGVDATEVDDDATAVSVVLAVVSAEIDGVDPLDPTTFVGAGDSAGEETVDVRAGLGSAMEGTGGALATGSGGALGVTFPGVFSRDWSTVN